MLTGVRVLLTLVVTIFSLAHAGRNSAADYLVESGLVPPSAPESPDCASWCDGTTFPAHCTHGGNQPGKFRACELCPSCEGHRQDQLQQDQLQQDQRRQMRP